MASVGRDSAQTVLCAPFVLSVAPGAIVAGFDVHRRQITFDALDTVTGEVWRGQLESTPGAVEQWVGSFPGPGDPCRGRGVHGLVVCLPGLRAGRGGGAPGRAGGDQRAARPQAPRQDRSRRRQVAARAAAAKGGCRRPGARPSMCASGARARGCATRCCPSAPAGSSASARRCITTVSSAPPMTYAPSPAASSSPGWSCRLDAAERLRVALEIIDMLDIQLTAIERDLRALARHQVGCRALMGQYGMGELCALVTLVELGDVTRMHASRQAVRLAGLDIGVHRSDRHAQLGKLTRQGSAPLRWALYEAAQSACRPDQPGLRRLPRAQEPRPVAHPRVADHRPQARPALLPPPPSARPCRARAPRHHSHPPLPPSPTRPRCVPHVRPAPAAIEAPTAKRGRPTKDRAAAVAPPERPINHQVTDRHDRQSRAQISQGVHGARQPGGT